jgi:hypothetical protein
MWRQDESGRVHTPFEPIVLAATLLLIPVLILEADAEGGWLTFAYFANWVIWGIFAAELVAVLYVASRRRAALRAHWLDVAIVVLTVPIVSSALGWGRLARFIRFMRFGIVVMAVGVAFVSLLTAAIAARFVRTEEAGTGELRDALARIEADLAEIKTRLG